MQKRGIKINTILSKKKINTTYLTPPLSELPFLSLGPGSKVTCPLLATTLPLTPGGKGAPAPVKTND
jgi:hypothetical protein